MNDSYTIRLLEIIEKLEATLRKGTPVELLEQIEATHGDEMRDLNEKLTDTQEALAAIANKTSARVISLERSVKTLIGLNDNQAATIRLLKEEPKSVRRYITQLEETISDYANSIRMVMDEDCASDEKHCTCVPALRARVKAAEIKCGAGTEVERINLIRYGSAWQADLQRRIDTLKAERAELLMSDERWAEEMAKLEEKLRMTDAAAVQIGKGLSNKDKRIAQLEDRVAVAIQILRYWMKRSASGQWRQTGVPRAMTKMSLDALPEEKE